jgi:hypothetical protein
MGMNGLVSEFVPSLREECTNGEAQEEGREEEGSLEGARQEEGWASQGSSLKSTPEMLTR